MPRPIIMATATPGILLKVRFLDIQKDSIMMAPTRRKAKMRPFLDTMYSIMSTGGYPSGSSGVLVPILEISGTRNRLTRVTARPAMMATQPPVKAALTFCVAAMATTTGI